MKCGIARMLLEFEFSLGQPEESVTYVNTITLPIRGNTLWQSMRYLRLQMGWKYTQSVDSSWDDMKISSICINVLGRCVFVPPLHSLRMVT